MEKKSLVFRTIENVFTSWAPDSVKDAVDLLEADMLNFFNPDLKNVEKPLTENYIFARFLPAVSIIAFYLVSVFLLPPILKSLGVGKSKEAEKTKKTTLEKIVNEPILLLALAYNLVQVVACSYIFMSTMIGLSNEGYGFYCNKIDYQEETLAKNIWLFFMSKILDLFDTYLIIFRGKWRQLSFLHVYHHSTVFFICWLYMRSFYSGDVFFIVVANTAVHVVMYSYYFLRILDFKIPLFLKMMVTNMQIIQFVSYLVQGYLILTNSCPFPTNLLRLYICYVIILLGLFVNFYISSYSKQNLKKKKKA